MSHRWFREFCFVKSGSLFVMNKFRKKSENVIVGILECFFFSKVG